jgi:hypothetical protein
MEQQMPTANEKSRAEQENKIYEQKRLRRAMRKRQAAAARQTVPGSGRAPSRTRTGTTTHFRLWMADLQLKSTLQRMKLDALADQPQPGKVASSLAIIRVNSSIRSVWDLAMAELAELLSIPQIGPARLAEIEQYLLSQNVKPRWTTAD